MVGQQNADIADTLQLRDVAVATIFVFLYMGVHWRHLPNTTEPSMCSGDAALCQITLTTCSCYYHHRHYYHHHYYHYYFILFSYILFYFSFVRKF